MIYEKINLICKKFLQTGLILPILNQSYQNLPIIKVNVRMYKNIFV